MSADDGKLRIVTWKWSQPNYRSTFTSEHVNILAGMVARFYPEPHEMVCFTDDPKGIESHIRVLPLPEKYSDVPSPHGPANPSCYRRLFMYSEQARDVIGHRFVSLDLDTVILDKMSPIWDRSDDFVIWGDTALRTYYNGSMMMMAAGSRKQVWEQFDPIESPKETRRRHMTGSDQAWISLCLGPGQPKWTTADGVYSFRNHINVKQNPGLPKNARIVFFHGSFDPWMPKVQQQYPWVKKFYRKAPATLLLLGNAPTVWEDVSAARAMCSPDMVFAINGTGVTWPHQLDHWLIEHEDHLIKLPERRRNNKLPKAITMHTTSRSHRHVLPAHIVKDQIVERASVNLALDFADRVILAGFDKEATQQNWDVQSMKSRVRAFSGEALSLFGTPDPTWLRTW